MLKLKLTNVSLLKMFPLLFLNLLLNLNLTSCNTTEPPIIPPPTPDLRKITLTIEDSSCTEVWLRVKLDSIALPAEIRLFQETIPQVISLVVKDSVIFIDSLTPSQTYNYQIMLNSDTTIKSEKVTTETLTPTSHNFTWQTFTFGEPTAGSSTLYDVTIIDENNIWAVGEIYTLDSLGQPDPLPYNLVHWDGSNWKLKRIMFYTICGQQNRTPYPIKSIWAINENEIWVAMYGDQLAKLVNGTQATTLCLPWSFSIYEIWSSGSNDFYVVGNGGNIAHFQNGSWIKIESGTTTNLLDVWGSGSDGAVWVSGKTDFDPTVLYKISNLTLLKMYESSASPGPFNPQKISGKISSIWTNNNREVYLLTYYGVYNYKGEADGKAELFLNIGNGGNWGLEKKIRGTGLNDIFVAGFKNTFWHFNGLTGQMNNQNQNNNDFIESLDKKKNIAVTVGQRYLSPLENYGLITVYKH